MFRSTSSSLTAAPQRWLPLAPRARFRIVTAVGVDPVGLGLATSLGRPGGNVTGFSHRPIELMGKRLQLLKYAFPGITQVAILANSQSTTTPDALRIAQQAAGELRVELTTVEAGNPDALRALGPASLAGADGLMTVPDALFWNQRRVIVAFAAAARVPAI